MVDFQSRDTRRGPKRGDDSDSPDETEEDESANDEAAAASDEDETTAEESQAATDAESETAAEADGEESDAAGDAEESQTAKTQTEEPRNGEAQTTRTPSETPSAESPSRPAAPESGGPAAGAAAVARPETGAGGESGAARDLASVSAAVVTVSPDRESDAAPARDAVSEALEARGHDVIAREVVRTNYDSVQSGVDALLGRDDVDVVVTTGGTGVTEADVTVEAIHPLLKKALPGFGELFRRRYAEVVGTDVVGTRATAGIADSTPIFCLPGDPQAARIGTAEIVAEQAPALVAQIDGDGPSDP